MNVFVLFPLMGILALLKDQHSVRTNRKKSDRNEKVCDTGGAYRNAERVASATEQPTRQEAEDPQPTRNHDLPIVKTAVSYADVVRRTIVERTSKGESGNRSLFQNNPIKKINN